MTAHITVGDTDIEQGDTVTLTVLKDGEEATATLDVTGSFTDTDDRVVVSMDGQAVGELGDHAPVGSRTEDAIGGLSLDHEDGIVRTVTGVEVA